MNYYYWIVGPKARFVSCHHAVRSFHLEDQVRASAAADRYVEVILQMSAAEGKFQGLIIKKLPGHLK